MMHILLLMIGGAIGTLARYLTSVFSHKWLGMSFPYGTFFVNILGSFAIGILWGLWERKGVSPEMKAFLFVGILGGFTTFSSFSLETMNLMKSGEYKIALLNVLANNIGGILFAVFGYLLGRAFSHWTTNE
jgi:fluoride exporter